MFQDGVGGNVFDSLGCLWIRLNAWRACLRWAWNHDPQVPSPPFSPIFVSMLGTMTPLLLPFLFFLLFSSIWYHSPPRHPPQLWRGVPSFLFFLFSSFSPPPFNITLLLLLSSGAEYAYFMEAFGPFPAYMFSWVSTMIIKPSQVGWSQIRLSWSWSSS